ncbi:19247_t:CDS:2 [Entrophospora sp. SA101]|nr:19247_t:CDS:2 [Entrophospora sp. SA101]
MFKIRELPVAWKCGGAFCVCKLGGNQEEELVLDPWMSDYLHNIKVTILKKWQDIAGENM